MSCNKLCEKLSVKKFSRNIDLNEKNVLGVLENSVYKGIFFRDIYFLGRPPFIEVYTKAISKPTQLNYIQTNFMLHTKEAAPIGATSLSKFYWFSPSTGSGT